MEIFRLESIAEKDKPTDKEVRYHQVRRRIVERAPIEILGPIAAHNSKSVVRVCRSTPPPDD